MEYTDEMIQRHLDYELAHGRDNYSSYRIIKQLLKERDGLMKYTRHLEGKLDELGEVG